MTIDDRHTEAARLRDAGLTQAETADAVGVSARTLRRWERRGLLSRALASIDGADDDEDAGPDTAAGDVRRTPSIRSNGDGTPLSLAAARARKEAALAEKHELELGRLRGDLVPLASVEALIRDATRPVDLGLRTAPRELAPAWGRRFGIAEAAALHAVRELCDEIRGRLTAAVDANVARASEVGT